MTLLCLVTCNNAVEARKIAKALLEKKLVACANILPKIESHYRWKGQLEKANETLLILKTGKKLRDKVVEGIAKAHGYELPVIEFIEADASKQVEKWIREETK